MNINDIELYFETFGYPDEDIEFKTGLFVLCFNAEFFVTKTIDCLRYHSGNKTFYAYWYHLLAYYNAVRKLDLK